MKEPPDAQIDPLSTQGGTAMYHAFVNQVLVPGGLIAATFCVLAAAMLWFNRKAYAPLFRANPE